MSRIKPGSKLNIICRFFYAKWISTLFPFIFFATTLIACDQNETNENSSTLDSFRNVKSFIKSQMIKTRTPSISIAVAKDGKIVWEESFGWANKEKQIKATPQTVYSLASISKPMTATAIMILVERGFIDLNKPVNSYLGDSKLTIYEGNEAEVSVERLLHHTAGLPTIWNFYFDGGQKKRPIITESIKQYGIITSPPGTVYEYSNLGYGIAEHIIEQVSGKRFDKFMKEEVFNPLGMTHSFVITKNSEYDTIASRYLENKNASPFYETMSRGGGGVCSSVHDLVRFGMFHLKSHLPDQKSVISDSTIDFMQTSFDPKVPDSPYKIGWDVKEINGYMVVNHGGGMPGVSSALLLVPTKKLAIAIVSNGTYLDLYTIGRRIISEIFPSKEEKQKSVSNKNMTNELNPELIGKWEGEIHLDDAKLPIILIIDENRNVTLTLLDIEETCVPIEAFRFSDNTLKGAFDFNIPTADVSICRHKVYMSFNLYNNRISGYAAAVSYRVEVFFLPYYISLHKQG